MEFTTEDNGPLQTLFEAFVGCNVRISTCDGTLNLLHHECQIVGGQRGSVVCKMFLGEEGEDEPRGEVVTLPYIDIEQVHVY